MLQQLLHLRTALAAPRASSRALSYGSTACNSPIGLSTIIQISRRESGCCHELEAIASILCKSLFKKFIFLLVNGGVYYCCCLAARRFDRPMLDAPSLTSTGSQLLFSTSSKLRTGHQIVYKATFYTFFLDLNLHYSLITVRCL